jgi:hypothetical protein
MIYLARRKVKCAANRSQRFMRNLSWKLARVMQNNVRSYPITPLKTQTAQLISHIQIISYYFKIQEKLLDAFLRYRRLCLLIFGEMGPK